MVVVLGWNQAEHARDALNAGLGPACGLRKTRELNCKQNSLCRQYAAPIGSFVETVMHEQLDTGAAPGTAPGTEPGRRVREAEAQVAT